MFLDSYHLQAYPLFRDCSDDEVLRFMTCVMPREQAWAKGQVLHDQDSPLDELWLVLDGRLALTRLGAGGQEVWAGQLARGQIYGQATAFSAGQSDPFALVALEDSRTLAFPAKAFYQQCAHTCSAHQKVIRNMLGDLAAQARDLSRRVRLLSAATLRGKIGLLLLDAAGGTPIGQPFTLPYSREEMADLLAVARPSLSRTLAGLKKEGIIDYDRRLFRILDPVRLEAGD